MQLTKKVRLYPNKTMAKILDNLCNYRRYCWNQGLELWYDLYDQRIEMVPASLRQKSQLVIKDKTIMFSKEEQELLDMFPSPSERVVRDLMIRDKDDWQRRLSSQVLPLAIRDLANAWSAFFNNQKSKTKKRKVGKPFFQTKKNTKQGFKTNYARIKNGKLVLDKPQVYKGDWYGISFKGYDLPDGKIKHCVITKVNNKYYASLAVDCPEQSLPKTNQKTAIDANVNHFDYTDGSFVVCPKQLDVLYEQIKHYQRVLARKRKVNGKKATQSNQYFKARTKLQRCYKRVTNIQNDLLHKFTTEIYHNYDTVVIEDLDVKTMQMSKKAKNLHRSLFGRFRLYMEYKADKFGKTLILADRYYPSTQRCSNCEHVKTGDDKITLQGNKKHGTKHNEYICYECGFEADRDKNAVLNLLALAK
jgi:transposase, IS605 orfB family